MEGAGLLSLVITAWLTLFSHSVNGVSGKILA